ncbi:MAG: hypothetical protein ABI589_03600 [Burkholderiales bacterium]
MKNFPLGAIAAAAVAAPLLSQAESNLAASTATTASAQLDFKITIPKVLFLRVGSGTDFVNGTTVNLMDFTVPADKLGDGTSVAASSTSGDLGNGAVTVRVFANHGNSATLTASTTGALTNAAAGGDTIPWTEIVATAAALPAASHLAGYATTVPHPAFPASGTGVGAVTTLTGTGKVIRADGQWTFAYKNSAPVAAGSYGGVSTQNSRVTYTVTQP